MKLTKETLKQIIKEEMVALLNEMEEADMVKAEEIAKDPRNMGDMQGMDAPDRINYIVAMYTNPQVSRATAAAAVEMMPY
jgi:hypothetical protein